MKYIKVRWIHSNDDYPVFFYSEINSERFETRKVVQYNNGKLMYADENEFSEHVFIGELSVPEIEEISDNPEFEASEISKTEFEHLWLQATMEKLLQKQLKRRTINRNKPGLRYKRSDQRKIRKPRERVAAKKVQHR